MGQRREEQIKIILSRHSSTCHKLTKPSVPLKVEQRHGGLSRGASLTGLNGTAGTSPPAPAHNNGVWVQLGTRVLSRTTKDTLSSNTRAWLRERLQEVTLKIHSF